MHKFLEDVCISLNLLGLFRRILLDELLNVHEAATNSDQDLLTFFNFDINPLLAELVNTLRFTQKCNVHPGPLGVLVYVIRQSFVNLVIFMGYVNRLILFQLVNDLQELLNFLFQEEKLLRFFMDEYTKLLFEVLDRLKKLKLYRFVLEKFGLKRN